MRKTKKEEAKKKNKNCKQIDMTTRKEIYLKNAKNSMMNGTKTM